MRIRNAGEPWWRVYIAAATVGVALLGAAVASSAARQTPPMSVGRAARAVVAGAETFLLGEAQALAGPRIRAVSPMPDGPYALIVREIPDEPQGALPEEASGGRPFHNGEVQVLLWNRRTQRVSVMWRKRADARTAVYVDIPEWFPGSGTALLGIGTQRLDGPSPGGNSSEDLPEPETAYYVVNVRSTAATRLPIPVARLRIMAPDQPFAVLCDSPPDSEDGNTAWSSFRVLGADGSVSSSLPLPEGASPIGALTADASALVVRLPRKPGERSLRYAAVRVSDGAVTALDKLPENASNAKQAMLQSIADLPVRLVGRPATLTDGSGARETVHAVWLERNDASSQPAGAPPTPTQPPPDTTKPVSDRAPVRRDELTLVTPDGEALMLTPDGGAALYLNRDGTLMAVPLERMETGAFLTARREAQKAQTLQNAKQIALGVLMYTMDYDEVLPPATGVEGIIAPYLRSSDVFNNPTTGAPGFRFVLPGGGPMGKIEKPAATVLGYLEGPGGRAVIYVDGHVTWEDAK